MKILRGFVWSIVLVLLFTCTFFIEVIKYPPSPYVSKLTVATEKPTNTIEGECSPENPPRVSFEKNETRYGNFLNFCGKKMGKAYEFKDEHIIIYNDNDRVKIISTVPPYEQSVLANSEDVFLYSLGDVDEIPEYTDSGFNPVFKKDGVTFWHHGSDGPEGSQLFLFSPTTKEFIYITKKYVVGSKSEGKIMVEHECRFDSWWLGEKGVEIMSKRFPDTFPCVDRTSSEMFEAGYFDLITGKFVYYQ